MIWGHDTNQRRHLTFICDLLLASALWTFELGYIGAVHLTNGTSIADGDSLVEAPYLVLDVNSRIGRPWVRSYFFNRTHTTMHAVDKVCLDSGRPYSCWLQLSLDAELNTLLLINDLILRLGSGKSAAEASIANIHNGTLRLPRYQVTRIGK